MTLCKTLSDPGPKSIFIVHIIIYINLSEGEKSETERAIEREKEGEGDL